jgi:hypothetical protein
MIVSGCLLHGGTGPVLGSVQIPVIRGVCSHFSLSGRLGLNVQGFSGAVDVDLDLRNKDIPPCFVQVKPELLSMRFLCYTAKERRGLPCHLLGWLNLFCLRVGLDAARGPRTDEVRGRVRN